MTDGLAVHLAIDAFPVTVILYGLSMNSLVYLSPDHSNFATAWPSPLLSHSSSAQAATEYALIDSSSTHMLSMFKIVDLFMYTIRVFGI